MEDEKLEYDLFAEYPDILILSELMEILKIGTNTAYSLLMNKKIYSKKIGREYKIPKICVMEYLYNKIYSKKEMLKKYKEVLDFNELLEILRNPSRNIIYKILKRKEIYSIKIAKSYKIPRTSVIEYIFNKI